MHQKQDLKLEEYSTASLTLSIAALEQPHTLPSLHAGSRKVAKVTKVGGCVWDLD